MNTLRLEGGYLGTQGSMIATALYAQEMSKGIVNWLGYVQRLGPELAST